MFKIKSVRSESNENRLFEVGSSSSARLFYQVRVETQPSCTCPDFKNFGERSPCKHLIFVLLYCQNIADETILQKTSFTNEEVLIILSSNSIDPDLQLPKKKGKGGKKRNAAFFREIMEKHPQYQSTPPFQHVTKVVRSATCSGWNCSQPLMIGERVIRVPNIFVANGSVYGGVHLYE